MLSQNTNGANDMNENTETNDIKQWHDLVSLPHYLVIQIIDHGMHETYENDKLVDMDDLHIALELATGNALVLYGNHRVVITDTHYVIQNLR